MALICCVWCWLGFNLRRIEASKSCRVLKRGITEGVEVEDCDRLVLPFEGFVSLSFHLVCSLHPQATVNFLTTSISQEGVHITFGRSSTLTVALGLDSLDQTFVVPEDEVSP
jgi:hypothetical protein